MSLNWREIALILEELPLVGSSLQQTIQHDFHSLSWNFYHQQAGRWTLYTELGTPFSRLHLASEALSIAQQGKTAKLQRFIQFLRANVEGSKVIEVSQHGCDRLVFLKLDNHGTILHLYLRFYSGPGANIIITDEQDIILELLYRRPGRGEQNGLPFLLGEPKTDVDDSFTVRPRTDSSFNRQIEQEYGSQSNELTFQELQHKVQAKRDRELKTLRTTLASQMHTLKASEGYERHKQTADLLSAYQHLLQDNQSSIELEDWETGYTRVIELEPKLKGRENILLYYDKYQKAKGAYENALTEVEKAKEQLDECEAHYARLLDPSMEQQAAVRAMKRELAGSLTKQQDAHQTPGLTIQSGQFTLLVGRNAKENDELLRRYARGNDYWMHTRDVPGGYVFIKYLKNKTVPLEVLLDAANLAIVFSKAKKEGKADLYYTQVKHLRRAKGGKTGLVLPTQEKNLSVTLDETRLARLLLEDDNA
ncbi:MULTISPECIES: NFACT family protein [Sphaerochaeta]|jgi:predicted ribosome quality control (RQC) complex YloA/Tae2 family protein|uniref:NFACT family protein n=1 Tax=Sphaerochaeta associata TaxID=1129264 RepID=A0ABY4D797_9SPIR|nr:MULTISPECIES: NFACT family protein [Sphaerochaeta]NLA98408.1 fibronectin-binding domain-containing protein [Spirochaetales bacterium]MDD2394407.1 NFACT family protein [Sphaerochaeta sp.]MDD3423619.1 NFACT family protein [Sphaerochaeta sp.]MDD3456829.1 NFACT family protein [Sphaerochaeta sp.]MDD4036863.1 NFACT family protein [Sphaerochaeta sp.]